MKTNISTFLLIVAFFFNNHSLFAEQLITIFLKPYPEFPAQSASQRLAPKLAKPGKLSSTRSKHILPATISGIFATYGGILTISNLNGEISFPRKHSKAVIYFFITENITPIIRSGNTINHWELEEDTPAAFYKMEQMRDEQINVNYWEVSKMPLPENHQIPVESLVLFADPKYVYVPLGVSIFQEGPHLILPDIYIKKGINLTRTALNLINVSHYFGSILPLYQKQPNRYSRQLTY